MTLIRKKLDALFWLSGPLVLLPSFLSMMFFWWMLRTTAPADILSRGDAQKLTVPFPDWKLVGLRREWFIADDLFNPSLEVFAACGLVAGAYYSMKVLMAECADPAASPSVTWMLNKLGLHSPKRRKRWLRGLLGLFAAVCVVGTAMPIQIFISVFGELHDPVFLLIRKRIWMLVLATALVIGCVVGNFASDWRAQTETPKA